MGDRDFGDARYWEELAEKRLPSHNLPKWSVPCSPQDMRLWAYRLGLTDYEKAAMTSMEDFIELNPAWPLRAFVGLLLEEAAG